MARPRHELRRFPVYGDAATDWMGRPSGCALLRVPCTGPIARWGASRHGETSAFTATRLDAHDTPKQNSSRRRESRSDRTAPHASQNKQARVATPNTQRRQRTLVTSSARMSARRGAGGREVKRRPARPSRAAARAGHARNADARRMGRAIRAHPRRVGRDVVPPNPARAPVRVSARGAAPRARRAPRGATSGRDRRTPRRRRGSSGSRRASLRRRRA